MRVTSLRCERRKPGRENNMDTKTIIVTLVCAVLGGADRSV